MGVIRLETFIRAPIERCFDLSRSVDLHILSTAQTNERAIDGVTSGLMKLGDVVTWEARHFGVKQKLTVKIVTFEKPLHFRDSQVKGIFHSFDHDHHFETKDDGTLMTDVFRFTCPFSILGKIADPVVKLHLKNFLETRNQTIKKVAEGNDWKRLIVSK
ncbi:MAG: SRPBCC family protein [Bdellovibrionales bacterium]|nr:SRPBCC family protein [Bdellovibrionales bacterium]